jgi:protein ImuB
MQQTQKLYAVCERAEAIGLASNMTLAEARAIYPKLQVAPAEPDADARALKRLAYWLVRYSPLVALDGNDGVLIDSTGCDHLFGGETALLNDIQSRLILAGFRSQLAIAETKGAAWALARYGQVPDGQSIIQFGPLEDYLGPLKMMALRIDVATAVTLSRLGLKFIGDIMHIPRPSLAKRFRGIATKQVTSLLKRIDEVFGRRDTPIEPLQPLPKWQVRQAFAEPVMDLVPFQSVLTDLLKDLTLALKANEQGVRRLSLTAFRVDGSVQSIMIGTNRPTSDVAHLNRLFEEKLDSLDAGFGFDLVLLAATETETLPPKQVGVDVSDDSERVAAFLDRVAIRLGPGAMCRLKHHESHLPERAQTYAPVTDEDLNWENFPTQKAERPIRLLARPEIIDVIAEVPEGPPMRFKWRRLTHKVARAEGPERISNEWWISAGKRTRDYYRIEIEDGARFWIFRYGLYGVDGVRRGECAQPNWYLHGFFA